MLDYEQEQKVDPFRNETIVAEGVDWEQFLTQYSEQHAEWHAGRVIVLSNNTHHQAILTFLLTLLNLYLGIRDRGQVFPAGVPMELAADQPRREPDLLVVLHENRERIHENYLEGPADIAVEVVSPGSTKRDRGDKFEEYESGGVTEYWLFDPIRKEAFIYGFGDDGYYHALPLDAAGRLVSRVLPGFALDAGLLWGDDLPAGAKLLELVQGMGSEG